MGRRTYLGMVTAMDDAVGNITQTLRGAKFTMWEGGTRTPAMIHSPSYLPRGHVSDLWLHVTDWYPTILSMAGLSSKESDLDGIDHWSQLQDPTLSGERIEMVYNIFYPTFTLGDKTPIAAIRKGNWKYIKRTVGFSDWTPSPPEQCSNYTVSGEIEDQQDLLFNIINDPSERNNLIDSEPGIAEDLKMVLEEYLVSLPDDVYPNEDHAGDPANFGGVWSDGWC